MANSGPIIAVSIDVGKARDDMTRLERTLNDRAIAAAMEGEVQTVLEDAKSLCVRDTGALANSLGIRKRRYRGGRILWYGVGPRRKVYRNPRTGAYPSRYAHFVEFGIPARGIPARPFLRPAFDKAVLTFASGVEKRLNALLGP